MTDGADQQDRKRTFGEAVAAAIRARVPGTAAWRERRRILAEKRRWGPIRVEVTVEGAIRVVNPEEILRHPRAIRDLELISKIPELKVKKKG